METLILGTQAAFTALSTDNIKTHLNITDSQQDSYVAALLSAAVVYCERRLQLDLRATTWTLQLDSFPECDPINLLRGPIQSVSSVTYYDADNVSTVLSTSEYTTVKPSFFPGGIIPVTYWPVSYPRPDAVAIAYTTGFVGSGNGSGAGAWTVPQNVVHAIRLLCGQWYAERENISYGPNTVMGATGMAVDALLDQFTVVGVG